MTVVVEAVMSMMDDGDDDDGSRRRRRHRHHHITESEFNKADTPSTDCVHSLRSEFDMD
jgi:hypothetical protein